MLNQDIIEKYYQLRDQLIARHYAGLNPEQREAVLTAEGPLLILAGAGSGKTSVLVNRIANLLRFGSSYKSRYYPADLSEDDLGLLNDYLAREECGQGEMPEYIAYFMEEKRVKPENILAVTFTNKAAKEMQERVAALVGEAGRKVLLTTFHSLAVRILRRFIDRLGQERNFVIYDTGDQLSLLKECLKEMNIDPKKFSPSMFLGKISKAKNELLTPEVFQRQAADFNAEIAGQVYQLYQQKLAANNALDFDDLLMKTVQLFKASPEVLAYYQEKFRYIMVDEYQDTNQVQYQMVRLMSAESQNICVVGDEDQSIYGWRGADIRNILDFERDYPSAKVVKLEKNYRSTQTILDAANSVIDNNTERKKKKLWSEKKGAEQITYYKASDQYDEAGFVVSQVMALVRNEGRRFGDCAVLYRTNAQSRAFEEVFMRQGLPYQIVGGTKFYDRKEIKDVMAYLKVLFNPLDTVSMLRIINVPKRSLGAASIAKVADYARENGLNFNEALCKVDEIASLSARTRNSFKKFLALLDNLQQSEGSVRELMTKVIKDTGYLADLEKENTSEAEDRIDNLQEFLSVAEEFDQKEDNGGLSGFLEQISLVSDLDSLGEGENGVVLMTLHSAKGLEYPVVFLVGMEEGIFPHFRALNNEQEGQLNKEMEEERRLCYVGITRAKEKLYLTSAFQRMMYGNIACNFTSRFLTEIPAELLEKITSF